MSETPPVNNPVTNPGGDGVQISGRQAAQGRSGSRTFIILIVALVLLVLVFGALLAMHSSALRSSTGPNSATGVGGQESAPAAAARTFHQPPPSPKQAPAGAPSTTGG